jgi:hypothetical protein
MGLAVVRCPTCRGESQVDPAALGLTVLCPRCDATFMAIEEAEVVAPTRPNRNPTTPPASERSRARRRPSRRPPEPGYERYEPDRELEPAREPQQPAEQDHDPHRFPPGGLPVSVLIGLALLPFAIPVLWLVGPAIIGEAPVLSIATPMALAVSASVLCLAVIYTIDWTPSTRVKGVLMLVSLAYFAAVSLYFLKKEMVEQIQKITGTSDGINWQGFSPPNSKNGDYAVNMPSRPPKAIKEQPILSLVLTCYQSSHQAPLGGRHYVFVVGSSEKLVKNPNLNGTELGTDAWYDEIERETVARSGGTLVPDTSHSVLQQDRFKGRELQIALGGDRFRVVRIFLIKGHVYYLSAEGNDVHEGEVPALRFFDSFFVNGVD